MYDIFLPFIENTYVNYLCAGKYQILLTSPSNILFFSYTFAIKRSLNVQSIRLACVRFLRRILRGFFLLINYMYRTIYKSYFSLIRLVYRIHVLC